MRHPSYPHLICRLLFVTLVLYGLPSSSFIVMPQSPTAWRYPSASRSTITKLFALPDISGMKVGEIRKELESYGIPTKSFLEKKEMVQALETARAEGKEPIAKKASDSDSDSQSASQSESKTSTTSKTSQEATKPRSERIKEEMDKAKQKSVSELRQALKDRGIRTTSFFEKSEFIKAYAEAVVDGVSQKSNNQQQQQSNDGARQEKFDPSYRDVTMRKMDPQSQQRLLQGGEVIDVKYASTR